VSYSEQDLNWASFLDDIAVMAVKENGIGSLLLDVLTPSLAAILYYLRTISPCGAPFAT
jgi:hypothetical protein